MFVVTLAFPNNSFGGLWLLVPAAPDVPAVCTGCTRCAGSLYRWYRAYWVWVPPAPDVPVVCTDGTRRAGYMGTVGTRCSGSLYRQHSIYPKLYRWYPLYRLLVSGGTPCTDCTSSTRCTGSSYRRHSMYPKLVPVVPDVPAACRGEGRVSVSQRPLPLLSRKGPWCDPCPRQGERVRG